jgi:hypothetical protein
MSETPLDFEILGPIHHVEVIATGRGVRVARWLRTRYGADRWRKMKGWALIRERNGVVHEAELHWFEAHGVGKVQWKIKP